MPRSLLCLLTILGLAGFCRAADITVAIDFDGPHSDRSLQQMKRETAEIFKTAGIHLDWRGLHDMGRDSYENLVVVHFKGKCLLDPESVLPDQAGPFAFVYNSDGVVMPFSEVRCDAVAAAVQSAMWGSDFARPDYVMGRALGRVVAHELVHILAGSASHGRDGVTQAAFSGRELIGCPLRLSRDDVSRIRRAMDGTARPGASTTFPLERESKR